MPRFGSSRAVPMGAHGLLHAAAFALTLPYAQAGAAYLPWLVVLCGLVAVGLAARAWPAVPALLALVVWSVLVQLVLQVPALPAALRLLLMAPLLAQAVLSLPRVVGPLTAFGGLWFFVAAQGPRLAWGQSVPATDPVVLAAEVVWGVVLVAAVKALKDAFRERDEALAEVSHLKEGVQQIVAANVAFQELAVSLEQSSVRKERLRITREIHDIVGYTLTNQTMVLQAAAVLLERDHDKLRDLLDSAQEAARSGLQDVRQALRQLRVGAERPQAFLNRLHQLCRTFEAATQVDVELSGAQVPDTLPPALELVLYRMVQEGLTNAFLHGQAHQVTVGITLDDALRLHLSDDGKGADHVSEGIGLTGMRERLAPFGGTLDYASDVHGFTIRASVPRAALWEDA